MTHAACVSAGAVAGADGSSPPGTHMSALNHRTTPQGGCCTLQVSIGGVLDKHVLLAVWCGSCLAPANLSLRVLHAIPWRL